MTAKQLLEKYCGHCVHKNECHMFCDTILAACFEESEEFKEVEE